MGDVKAWADEHIMGLHRRLALARQIEASAPGVQPFVQLDESSISTATQAEVDAAAEQVADALNSGGTVDEAILSLLEQHKNDPYFAAALAKRVDLEKVALTVHNAGTPPNLGYSTDPMGDQQKWKTNYTRLLDSLGQTLGLASRGTGDVAPPKGWNQKWIDLIASTSGSPWVPSNLALVVSRGRWSTEFSVGLTQAIYALETGDRGHRGMWNVLANPGQYMGATTPDGQQAYDPLALVLQAVARDPAAAISLIQGSPTVTIEHDGHSLQVSSFVDYLMTQRKWPVDNGLAAGQVLAAAVKPFAGSGVDGQTAIMNQIQFRSESFAAEVAARSQESRGGRTWGTSSSTCWGSSRSWGRPPTASTLAGTTSRVTS